MTFGEATARLVGDLAGMYHAFFRPIVSVRDAAGFMHASKVPTMFDFLVNVIKDPASVERYINLTSFDHRGHAEGGIGRRAFASSDVLRDTPGGRLLTRTANILGKPIQWASLNRMTGAELMWGVFDYFSSLTRVLGYGLMDMADRPFAMGAYFSEVAAQIYRAKQLKPDLDVKDLWNKVLDRRFDKMARERGIGDPETLPTFREMSESELALIDLIDEAGMKHSQYMTFKDQIESTPLRNFGHFMNQNPWTRALSVLFYNTPVRIYEKAFAMTPGASLLWKQYRDDLLGRNGVRAQNMAIARQVVGTIIYAIGLNMAFEGKITPNAKDHRERRAMQEAGMPENSVKIGDQWISMTSIDPVVGHFFRMMANTARILRERDDEETYLQTIGKGLFAVVQSVLSNTFMTGVRELIEAFYNERGAEYFLEGLKDTMKPLHGFRRAATSIDLGGLNPFYNEIMTDAEGLPMLDTFGKYRPNFPHIMGIGAREESDSPIRKELLRLGITLSPPSNTINGIQLTDELHWEMWRYMETGLKAEDKMNELIKSERYKSASIEEKQDRILAQWSALKARARAHIVKKKEFQELLEQHKAAERERRRVTEVPAFPF